eukprot:15358174-Alexandrium_andersonii.AAC.2
MYGLPSSGFPALHASFAEAKASIKKAKQAAAAQNQLKTFISGLVDDKLKSSAVGGSIASGSGGPQAPAVGGTAGAGSSSSGAGAPKAPAEGGSTGVGAKQSAWGPKPGAPAPAVGGDVRPPAPAVPQLQVAGAKPPPPPKTATLANLALWALPTDHCPPLAELPEEKALWNDMDPSSVTAMEDWYQIVPCLLYTSPSPRD